MTKTELHTVISCARIFADQRKLDLYVFHVVTANMDAYSKVMGTLKVVTVGQEKFVEAAQGKLAYAVLFDQNVNLTFKQQHAANFAVQQCKQLVVNAYVLPGVYLV